MFRPHDREDAELDEVRLAAEGVEDAVIFVGGETVLGDHLGGDAGSFEDVHAARSSCSLTTRHPELVWGSFLRWR